VTTGDLTQRLSALESLRAQVGPIAKAILLVKLWVTRMGLAVVASVALPGLVFWFAQVDGEMPPLYVGLALVGIFVPLGLGVVAILPPTVRVFSASGSDADAVYRARFGSELLQPLVQGALPGATLDLGQGIDRAIFDGSGLYSRRGERFDSQVRIRETATHVTWQAAPVRSVEVRRGSSTTGDTSTGQSIVIHDGLFVWIDVTSAPGAPLVVADTATALEAQAKAHALKALVGRMPELPATGDAAFDREMRVISDAHAIERLTPDLRRALRAAMARVGAPVRIAVGPAGVALAFPGRGRLAGVAASADIETTLGFAKPETLLANAASALEADARLLAAIPQAVTLLTGAVASAR
jgi:hypothetical protein